jgi:DNA-binding response OmpR family regulator
MPENILVVDDTEAICNILTSILETENYYGYGWSRSG